MKDMDSATRVQDGEGRQYHIGLKPGELAPYVLFLGDPDRAERVASRLDAVELRRSNREFHTVTGTYRGLRISAMGTGIGCDNTEIAVIETCQVADRPTILRVGSCGSLRPEIEVGHLVVTSAAIRLESTSTFFVPEGYPAFAHHEVILALLRAGKDANTAVHLGITVTAAGFYGAQGRDIPGFPPRRPDLPEEMARAGAANFEMEASTLLSLAALRGFRAGAVCAVFANRPHDRFIPAGQKEKAEGEAIRTGLEALRILSKMDEARGTDPHWLPDF
ncbi:MAG: nucleoside phosphorylase [Planctomycetota bacterium]|jgi:uridine phosphorylase